MGNKSVEKERLTFDNLIRIIFHIARQFDNQYYTGFAASIAYFFFMASMPTLIVLSQLMGVFDVSLDFIKDWLELHISSHMSSFVMGLFSTSSVKFTNVLMVIVALWSASSLQFCLSRLSSFTLTDGSYRFQFFSERLKAIPYSLISLVSIAFSLVIFVYGDALFSKWFSMTTLGTVLLATKTPIALFLFFTMVLINYYILPRVRVPIRAILPGAIVASVGILLITSIYSLYIGYIADYNILYGAFANIVALMLWFYLISWVLCIGMMYNKAWDVVMKRNRLSRDKMIDYLKKQYHGEDAYRKYLIHDEDTFNPEHDSIAVNLSKKFVKGYYKELKQEKKEQLLIYNAIRKALDEVDRTEYVNNNDEPGNDD